MNSAALWRVPQWFAGQLDERALDRLQIYHVELIRWTQKINLISPSTIKEADRIHFADGLLGAQAVLKDAGQVSKIWDLGSGNGIPGVIFSILRPAIDVLCVDSDERKVSFITQLSIKLDLPKLSAKAMRVENIEPAAIDIAVARGFAPLERGLPVANHAFSPAGVFYHFKGPEWSSEIEAIPKEICSTWNTSLLGTYDLPSQERAPGVNAEVRTLLKSVKIN